MIQLRPFDDVLGYSVFRTIDPHDWREAQVVRGSTVTQQGLFADWRGVEGVRLLSQVAVVEYGCATKAFAVFGLAHTGQAGVAAAALIARDHQKFRRPLAELGAAIRAELPQFMAERGIARIECRCWDEHPTAARFLTAVGFTHEADMPGFGSDGRAVFRQFAYVPGGNR